MKCDVGNLGGQGSYVLPGGRAQAGQSVLIAHLQTGAQIQILGWRYSQLGLAIARPGKFTSGNPIAAPITASGYPDDPRRPVIGMASIQVGYETSWNEGYSAGMGEYSPLISPWHGNSRFDSTPQNTLSFKSHAQVDLLIEAMGGFSVSSSMQLGNYTNDSLSNSQQIIAIGSVP